MAKGTTSALRGSASRAGGGSTASPILQSHLGMGATGASASAAGASQAAGASVQPTSATPYLDIAKAYEDQYRANLVNQEAQLAQQLAASKNASNRQYESAANANYLNYLKQRNALGEQLAAQHINGGASETANVNMMNNYALNRGNTEASRIAALGQLQSTYDTNIANMRANAENEILNNNLALRQAQIQYEDTLAQRELENQRYAEEVARQQQQYNDEQKWKKKEYKDTKNSKTLEQYAATISRYTSAESIGKAIKSLKSKKPTNYKQMIWLLQQRKAELEAQ